MILTITTAFVIIGVNVLLKFLIIRLGRFMRYKTITKEITDSTLNLFYAMFINTAIITIIVIF